MIMFHGAMGFPWHFGGFPSHSLSLRREEYERQRNLQGNLRNMPPELIWFEVACEQQHAKPSTTKIHHVNKSDFPSPIYQNVGYVPASRAWPKSLSCPDGTWDGPRPWFARMTMPDMWGFHKWGYNGSTPKWMVFNGNPVKMDELRVPSFEDTG